VRSYKRVAYSKRVLVNLKSGAAFRGFLVKEVGQLLVLQQAELIEPGAESVSVPGEILIDKGNVEFIQVIGG
jgi:small nuclear ribonucleoprotein (snRNP)-like protein